MCDRSLMQYFMPGKASPSLTLTDAKTQWNNFTILTNQLNSIRNNETILSRYWTFLYFLDCFNASRDQNDPYAKEFDSYSADIKNYLAIQAIISI